MLIDSKEDSNLYNELYNTLQSVDTILKEIKTNLGEWKTYFRNNEFLEADALKDNRSRLINKFYEIYLKIPEDFLHLLPVAKSEGQLSAVSFFCFSELE